MRRITPEDVLIWRSEVAELACLTFDEMLMLHTIWGRRCLMASPNTMEQYKAAKQVAILSEAIAKAIVGKEEDVGEGQAPVREV